MRVADPVSISTGSCGLAKRSSPRSRMALNTTIAAPRFEASRKVPSMRGWLVPGLCPMEKIASAVVEVLELDCPLADADRLRQSDARRLVAHVRAVGKLLVPNSRA